MTEKDALETFEGALTRLEEIVEQMESGDVGLEQAVALFEEGRKHLALCRERLTNVQSRIAELTAGDEESGEGASEDDAPA